MKLIFSAVLVASLLAAGIASSASIPGPAGPAPTKFRDKWLIDDGVRTMLVDADEFRDGTQLVGLDALCVKGSCGCPYENEDLGYPTLVGLDFAGSHVYSDPDRPFLACATSEKLVKDCAAKGSYETAFRGTISADGKRIHGEYHADGWGFIEKGDIWTNCHADEDFEAWLPVDMTLIERQKNKPCGPDVDKGFVYMTPNSGKSSLYQNASTSSPVIGNPPAGARLVYTQVSTENGQTWYYVNPPSATPGWAPAADVSCDRPIPLPPKRKLPVDPNAKLVVGTGAYTSASRG